jgi:hypothetical protein
MFAIMAAVAERGLGSAVGDFVYPKERPQKTQYPDSSGLWEHPASMWVLFKALPAFARQLGWRKICVTVLCTTADQVRQVGTAPAELWP